MFEINHALYIAVNIHIPLPYTVRSLSTQRISIHLVFILLMEDQMFGKAEEGLPLAVETPNSAVKNY